VTESEIFSESARPEDEVEIPFFNDTATTEIYTGSIIGVSEPMRRVMRLIGKIAATESTVLITGESGTGKELIASAIHYQSARSGGPFLPINAGALPESLVESELFGHVRGAFTGATQDKKGLFEEADGGTIFLDEVGELSPAVQVKLLRVLQQHEVRRVGGNRQIYVDVRVIAATNQDLKLSMENGRFREDLFYRLNVLHIHLPPLRDRRDDIPVLARYCLEQYSEKLGKNVETFAPRAQLVLMNYDYPGNVRELQNAIERGVALADGSVITEHDLPPEMLERGVPRLSHTPDDVYPETLSLREVEERHIRRVLSRFGGNATRAAESLGISRATLWRKLKRMAPTASD
jgi:transcriptional regulator with PAS, ATPase and Fis domain